MVNDTCLLSPGLAGIFLFTHHDAIFYPLETYHFYNVNHDDSFYKLIRADSMSTYTRIWHVSEQELQEEIAFLKQDPACQLPLHLSYDQYEKLLRKIAYWHISRMNIIALGVINLLLIGGSVMVYNARNNLAWMNAVLIKVLLVIIVIHAGIYFLAGIPLNKYKTKLSVK